MELGAPAALPPGNDYPKRTEYEDEWTSESVWVPMEKKSHIFPPQYESPSYVIVHRVAQSQC